ncbi:MAG: RidA family protein [Myxococcota bacterium]|nr:RidA family protein [Myxococcota bacterium]
MTLKIIQPAGWAKPRGYSNGIIAEGQLLVIGGQIGWNAQQIFERSDFVGQFDQTLANIRSIIDEAGAQPNQIVKMTAYVTDLSAYRENLREIGRSWKQHLGRWYPAMALVGVTGLVEPQALVEIETLLVIPAEASI